MVIELDPEEVVRQVTERLRAKYPDATADEVEAVVRDEVTQLADKPVNDYVSVLAERAAKKRLKK